MNKSVWLMGILLSAVILSTGCNSTTPQVGNKTTHTKVNDNLTVTETEKRYTLPSGKIAGEDSTLIEAKAIVENVDRAKRLVTIKTVNGQLIALKAGDEIRNFAQIAPGDEINVEYYLSIAFEAREPTQSELELSSAMITLAGRAEKGEKPGARVAQGQVTVMTIESIDKANQLVVLRNLSGAYSTVKAKYPENLATVTPGDKIIVTLTEALAAKITEVN